MVKKSPKDWLYGYQQAMEFAISRQSQYQQVLMTDFYGQPYIYYLFYSRYPPRLYQLKANLLENNSRDVGKIEKIDNITFTSVNLSSVINSPDSVLAILSHDEILRQGIDQTPLFKQLIPLSPINSLSTFYAWEKP